MKFSNFAVTINTKCNLNCDYCFIPPEDKQGYEMSYITLNCFRRLTRKYGSPPLKVDVFGTEPFISWDKLMHLINMAGIFRWKIGVTTNGTLITQDRAEILAEKKVNLLVSYDGSRKSHNRFRKFKSGVGSWQKVVDNLKLLQDAGVEYGCAMTVSPENLPYLLHNVKSAATRGFQFIALNPQFTIGKEPHPLGYDWEMLRKKYRQAVEWSIAHEVRLLFTFDAFETYTKGKQKALSATCGAARGSIAMDWDGQLYICHRACGRKEFKIGEVLTGPVPELVQSYRIRDVNECHVCPLFAQRGSCGHCWTIALDMTGDMTKVPDAVCMWQSIINDVDMSLYHQAVSSQDNRLTIKKTSPRV